MLCHVGVGGVCVGHSLVISPYIVTCLSYCKPAFATHETEHVVTVGFGAQLLWHSRSMIGTTCASFAAAGEASTAALMLLSASAVLCWSSHAEYCSTRDQISWLMLTHPFVTSMALTAQSRTLVAHSDKPACLHNSAGCEGQV